MEDNDKDYIFRWGLSLKDLYAVALQFFKEKEGNVIQFSYEEKLRLIAFTRQVTHGKYKEDTLPPLGVLDVIGRDRRLAWQALGDMPSRDAMAGFIRLIDKRCLHFNAFVQAHKMLIGEQKHLIQEKQKNELEEMTLLKRMESVKTEDLREELTRKHIQNALNEQTYPQFKTYAQQQFPENPEQRALLIHQLQEQHYHQYMLQLQQIRNPIELSQNNEKLNNERIVTSENKNGAVLESTEYSTEKFNDMLTDSDDSETSIYPATMWTRKDIAAFKNQVKNEGNDTIMKIGHGEIVTSFMEVDNIPPRVYDTINQLK